MPDTDEQKIGGNIALIGFGALEPIELIVVKKITGNYVKKISEIAQYKQMKLSLKQHQHSKSFLHELETEIIITQSKEGGKDIVLAAKSTDRNLYTALADVLEKIYNEALHHSRSAKEIGEGRIRKERKENNKEEPENEDSLEI